MMRVYLGSWGGGFIYIGTHLGKISWEQLGGLIENADSESSGLRWGVRGCIDEAPRLCWSCWSGDHTSRKEGEEQLLSLSGQYAPGGEGERVSSQWPLGGLLRRAHFCFPIHSPFIAFNPGLGTICRINH